MLEYSLQTSISQPTMYLWNGKLQVEFHMSSIENVLGENEMFAQMQPNNFYILTSDNVIQIMTPINQILKSTICKKTI